MYNSAHEQARCRSLVDQSTIIVDECKNKKIGLFNLVIVPATAVGRGRERGRSGNIAEAEMKSALQFPRLGPSSRIIPPFNSNTLADAS